MFARLFTCEHFAPRPCPDPHAHADPRFPAWTVLVSPSHVVSVSRPVPPEGGGRGGGVGSGTEHTPQTRLGMSPKRTDVLGLQQKGGKTAPSPVFPPAPFSAPPWLLTAPLQHARTLRKRPPPPGPRVPACLPPSRRPGRAGGCPSPPSVPPSVRPSVRPPERPLPPAFPAASARPPPAGLPPAAAPPTGAALSVPLPQPPAPPPPPARPVPAPLPRPGGGGERHSAAAAGSGGDSRAGAGPGPLRPVSRPPPRAPPRPVLRARWRRGPWGTGTGRAGGQTLGYGGQGRITGGITGETGQQRVGEGVSPGVRVLWSGGCRASPWRRPSFLVS